MYRKAADKLLLCLLLIPTVCLLGLFAISKAKQGGESTFVSSYTIHNELIKRGRTVSSLPAFEASFPIFGLQPA